MAITNADGIVTPDEDNTLDPEVYLAAMADSISQGLGERMKLQETRVSLRATTPVPYMVNSTGIGGAYPIVPLGISGNVGARGAEPDFSAGNHANGVIMEGNYAKIVTPGLYTIIGQVTIYNGDLPDHSWDFFGMVNGSIFGLPTYGATNSISFTYGFVSDTRYLAANDMISLVAGVGTDHVGGFRVQDALLTVAMLYAIPEI